MSDISWKIPIYTWRFQYISKVWKFNILDFKRRSDPISIQKKKHPNSSSAIPLWYCNTQDTESWVDYLINVNQLRCLPSSLSTTKSQIDAIIQVGKWMNMACHSSKCYLLAHTPPNLISKSAILRQLDVTPWRQVPGVRVPVHTLVFSMSRNESMSFQRPNVSFHSTWTGYAAHTWDHTIEPLSTRTNACWLNLRCKAIFLYIGLWPGNLAAAFLYTLLARVQKRTVGPAIHS